MLTFFFSLTVMGINIGDCRIVKLANGVVFDGEIIFSVMSYL